MYQAILLVVPQSSTQSESFFRLSVISRDMLAQALGEPLVLSDCIQALGTLVSNKISQTSYYLNIYFLWFHCYDRLSLQLTRCGLEFKQ